MTIKNKAVRRLVAGIATLALGIAGAAGAATAASAEVPGNIDPAATGSIIIHKHVKDETNSTPGNPAGDPLGGVTFRVTEILLDGSPVPLATAEGWAAIDGVTVADIGTGGLTKATTSTETAGTDVSGVTTAGGLGLGLYLVEEIGSGSNLITTPAAPFLVTIPYPGENGWDYDVDVYPKNVLGETAPTKTVGTPDKPADVELGAVVPFEITVPVAQSDLPYVSFSIQDSLSAGLEFVSWGAVSIGGVNLDVETDYTVSEDDSTITLTDAGIAKLNAITKDSDTEVKATINAKVTDLGQLANTATATINGTPGTTPEVTTNWAQLDITKVDAETTDVLAGATFELYADDKNTLLATGITDADGKLSFVVWVGNNADITETVYLKETVAPQGYVLPADQWSEAILLTAGTTAELSITPTTIENSEPTGPGLPLTGAAGTLAMTIAGLALLTAGAGAMLYARNRRNQQA